MDEPTILFFYDCRAESKRDPLISPIQTRGLMRLSDSIARSPTFSGTIEGVGPLILVLLLESKVVRITADNDGWGALGVIVVIEPGKV
jgi:hypothetical protein